MKYDHMGFYPWNSKYLIKNAKLNIKPLWYKHFKPENFKDHFSYPNTQFKSFKNYQYNYNPQPDAKATKIGKQIIKVNG